MSIENLITIIKNKKLNVDIDLVKLAFEYAERAHRGQKRLSGEDYINHPLATAIRLAELGLDEATIIAGLLHDVLEDTGCAITDIEKEFGTEVASLVAGVTKLGTLKYRGIERYVENLRKMFIAIAEDVRVIFIKFADRLHNLSTLDALPPEKRYRVALESLEIYAAIANRLGMGELKGELEDKSFPYVYPKEYAWAKRLFDEKVREKKTSIDSACKSLREKLSRAGFHDLEIHGRVKHLWSFYKKLQRKHIAGNVDRIHDIVAIRVIINNDDIGECYAILGIIHSNWTPLPGQIDDYIATPKPSGYRSLHTTVFGPGKDIIEIQIRTHAMHVEAEYGIAAHFIYEELEKKDNVGRRLPKNIKWLKNLLNWQKEAKENPGKFLRHLKMDFFENRIFVFTPKGDVVDLPEDATVIDFAYAIHTDIGDSCVGANVNNKHVALSHKLRSGDVVRITTDKRRKYPSQDWLKFIKTNMAHDKIQVGLRRKKGEE